MIRCLGSDAVPADKPGVDLHQDEIEQAFAQMKASLTQEDAEKRNKEQRQIDTDMGIIHIGDQKVMRRQGDDAGHQVARLPYLSVQYPLY